MKKVIVLTLSVLIFLPLIIFLKIINIFYKLKILRISSILGGNMDLYPFLIKLEHNELKRELLIIFISDIERVYSNKELYNLFWLKSLFYRLSPLKIKNENFFYFYNKFCEALFLTIRRFKINNLILKLNDLKKKEKGIEKHFIHVYENKKTPLISINLNDEQFDLRNLNLKKNFISFSNRDPAYKKKQYPEFDMNYHDFRNFEIDDFIKAVKNFTKKNYSLIRMGIVTEKKMKIEDSKYHDFSKNFKRSGELETLIISKSKFFVGPESGLDKIAAFLNIPIVYVNIHHLLWRPYFLNRCIFIPQKLKNLKTGKVFSFREMLSENIMINNENIPLGLYYKSSDYENNNIQVINNTPEEINTAMEEMEFYLKNNFTLDKKDKEFQKTFWQLYGNDFPVNKTHIISPAFLRNNLDLLNK